MLDLIASVLVRGINRIFHITPIYFNLWLGSQLGTLIYFLSGKRNKITYSNLKAAFCGEKSPEEIKRITKNTYRNMAMTFAEILSMTKVDGRYFEKFIKIPERIRIEDAAASEDGMIFLSAHFGNWELTTIVSALMGNKLYLLVRDQKMKRLNELLNRLRELPGNHVVRKGADVKTMFRILKDGKGVGILGDQNAGDNGMLLDFFGRPASTAVGPYRIAQKCGAVILPAFIHRVKGPYHEIAVEEPMLIKKDDDIKTYMEKYLSLLEGHIRKYPDQWLWMHKKWKKTTVKKVMVLDDGKAGHLKQSLAVFKQIKKYRADEGYDPEDLELEVVRVNFRSKMSRAIFNLMIPFSCAFCQWHLKFLKGALEPDSYMDLVHRYADVIISCASALSGVNKVMKIENNARNVAVLDPGPLKRRSFDIIIVPEHDFSGRAHSGKNIIVTDLAPNLIERSVSPGPRDGKCLGLLFGGDNPDFAFSDELAEAVSGEMVKACKKTVAGLYVTTSRRTPEKAEKILKERFSSLDLDVRFVEGNKDSDKYTVEKILAESDVVVVSGESISMVSEAVASGKPVVVFMPDRKNAKDTKYDKFIKNLEKRKYVKVADPMALTAEITRAISGDSAAEIPDDNRRIYEKMYKLF